MYFNYDPVWMVFERGLETSGGWDERLFFYTADDERFWTYHATGGDWTIRDLDGKVLRDFRSNVNGWTVEHDHVYRNGQLVATDSSIDGIVDLHLDHLGTPRLTTRSGWYDAYHVYYPYGEEASYWNQDRIPMKFTGHERDFYDTGGPGDDLDYQHARYYDFRSRRYLIPDPIGGYPKVPQSWNRYTYTLGNPLKYVDPNGEETQLVVGGHTENNVIGHAALAINGTVYSFGTAYVDNSGDWGVSLAAYLGAQDSKRSTTLMTLDLSIDQEKQLAATLEGSDPRQKPYSVVENSCVTVCEQELESIGVLPNDPGPVHTDTAGNQLQAGAPQSLTPGGLVAQVQDAGIVESSSSQGQERVSKLKALLNTIGQALKRLGN